MCSTNIHNSVSVFSEETEVRSEGKGRIVVPMASCRRKMYPFGVKLWIYGPSTESVSYELRITATKLIKSLWQIKKPENC
jgi:hypothetical protein